MIELGLQRISRLLERTPLKWRAIHVAGTNGKGSICHYISAMLNHYNTSKYQSETQSDRLNVGRFTSPHLVDRWDCISVRHQPVSFEVFDRVEREVKKRNEQERINASEFELLTATAFEIFTLERLNVGIIEVGMGGRLDATNIIGRLPEGGVPDPETLICSLANPESFRPRPLVTAIAKIGLDHQGFLGNSIQEIAREKAGIIKPTAPVVLDYSNDSAALEVLEDAAGDNEIVTFDNMQLPELKGNSNDVLKLLQPHSTVQGAHGAHQMADHQRQNLSVAFRAAWTALRRAGALGKGNPIKHIENRQELLGSLASGMLDAAVDVKFPGRQQSISIESLTGRQANIILDGAHNAQSAQALAKYVTQQFGAPGEASRQPVTWVVAASDSKDVREIVEPLLNGGDSIVAVEFGPVDGMPWVNAMPAAKIEAVVAQLAQERKRHMATHSCGAKVKDALQEAVRLAGNGPLVVAGSLYLVGDVFRLLRHSEAYPGGELEEGLHMTA